MKHLRLDGAFLDVVWVDGLFGVSLGLAHTYTSVNFYFVGNILVSIFILPNFYYTCRMTRIFGCSE